MQQPSNANQPRLIKNLILITSLEAAAALIFMLALPKSAVNGVLFGFSSSRLALILALLLINLGLAWLTIRVRRNPSLEDKIDAFISTLSQNDKQREIALFTLSTFLFVITFLLIVWAVTEDKFLLGYLLRFGPILILGELVIIQGIILLTSHLDKVVQRLWLQSLILGIILLLLQEWPLIVTNKLDDYPAIAALFGIVLYAQNLFRREIRSNPKNLAGMALTSIIVGVLIYTQLFFIPKRFLSFKQTLFIGSPIILLGLPILANMIGKLIKKVYPHRLIRSLLYLLLTAFFIFAGRNYYLAGNTHAEQINVTYAPQDDELAYMEFAIKARETNFRFTGFRNQMPVYPFIQALFYKPGESLEEFYARGKQVNILLSLASLAVVFFISRKFLPHYQAANMTIVTGFGLYVFKSGYFMVELLFYTMAFAVYLLLCLLLIRPSNKLSITAGILLGFTHFTKASVLPAVILFAGVFLLVETIRAAQNWRMSPLSLNNIMSLPGLRERIINLSLVIVCFLGVISPYIIESKRIYGSYFYNVNSTFYMWYDSYEEAEAGTIAHGDHFGWPDLPADQIPSAGKYFREHTFSQILDRIKYGLHWQAENIRYQYGFFNYPFFLLPLTLVTLSLDLKKVRLFIKQYHPIMIFSVLYFLGYTALYNWYSPIANLPRFLYALYVPLIFSLFFLIKKSDNELNSSLIKSANLTIFIMVCIDIWYIASFGPFNRDFGS